MSNDPGITDPQIPTCSGCHGALPVLRRGDQNIWVRKLHELLRKHRCQVVAANTFGPITEITVRSFQHLHGLKVDGVVGPHTWRALLNPIVL